MSPTGNVWGDFHRRPLDLWLRFAGRFHQARPSARPSPGRAPRRRLVRRLRRGRRWPRRGSEVEGLGGQRAHGLVGLFRGVIQASAQEQHTRKANNRRRDMSSGLLLSAGDGQLPGAIPRFRWKSMRHAEVRVLSQDYRREGRPLAHFSKRSEKRLKFHELFDQNLANWTDSVHGDRKLHPLFRPIRLRQSSPKPAISPASVVREMPNRAAARNWLPSTCRNTTPRTARSISRQARR